MVQPLLITTSELPMLDNKKLWLPTLAVAGHSNTLAWVLGVVFGVLGGLIFAALLAWAIVACMRRRREREENEGQDPPSNKKSFIPGKPIRTQFRPIFIKMRERLVHKSSHLQMRATNRRLMFRGLHLCCLLRSYEVLCRLCEAGRQASRWQRWEGWQGCRDGCRRKNR